MTRPGQRIASDAAKGLAFHPYVVQRIPPPQSLSCFFVAGWLEWSGWRFRVGGPDSVGLSEIDRNLLERCLQKKPRAWEDFVDRFMGLVLHVIRHSAQARSIRLTAEDRDDLCAEVFLAIVQNDFAVLRNFGGRSSLATYLTVVARRVVVRELLAQRATARLAGGGTPQAADAAPDQRAPSEARLDNQEEVGRLMEGLEGAEAQVVRMYHLEGKSYREIGSAVGLSENSIGPILSRARDKLRRTGVNSSVGS